MTIKCFLLVPIVAPTNVTLASLDSTTIQVCWEKIPYFPTLDGYEVLYKPFNQTNVNELVTLTNAEVSSVTIRVLEPYQTYSVTVAGKTIAGLGQRSIPETLQPTNYTGKCHWWNFSNWAFSNDVTTAILVYQKNETATMLVFQSNPRELKFFLM